MREPSEMRQLRDAVGAMVQCLVQAMAESDPNIKDRVQQKLNRWHGRFVQRGEHEAAAFVRLLERELNDPEFGAALETH
jgi:hypothetical protein